jgi:hypothetical protein
VPSHITSASGQAVRVGEPHDIPRYGSVDMEIERSAGRLLRKRGNAQR